MKVWIWLKPSGLEHKYRPALSVKTPRWFLNVLTLDPVPTYIWVVALGVCKAEGISCLFLPCIPFSDLRAFILIVVSSLWANINLNKMMEVTNIILLEAVGWRIGLPAWLWLWSNKMLPLEPPMLFTTSWGPKTASQATGWLLPLLLSRTGRKKHWLPPSWLSLTLLLLTRIFYCFFHNKPIRSPVDCD